MALSGLDIYKLLPRTNCKECGYATCLAFAMALAQKKASLDKCPHVTAQAKEALDSASQPPIRLVTIGTGENRLEIGNETVMYRHEQKFYHPTGVGFLLEDTLTESEQDARIAKINALVFERVGQKIRPDLICIKGSSNNKDKFVAAIKRVSSSARLAMAFCASDPGAVEEAVKICREKRPLVICEESARLDAFAKLAKENNLPLAVTSNNLDDAAELTGKAKKAGLEEIVIGLNVKSVSKTIGDLTFLRRSALKKNFRPLGYPSLVFTESTDPSLEAQEAAAYIAKYAGLVIIKNIEKEFVFPILVARSDIYTDPQKPVQVEPKIYEIGKPTKDSPVLVTTNFSITYFTVAGEVESSKVASYIISCDSEGMSVLTAWAAEKFTAEKIAQTLKKSGIEDLVSHRKVIIPGYVSVLSGKLEEESSWKVQVGPREASGIPNFLRSWKA